MSGRAKFTIGCEALGAVQEFDDFRIFHSRNASDGIFHQRREALPIWRQQLILKSCGMPFKPKGRLAFISARYQTANLLTPIHEQIGSRNVGKLCVTLRWVSSKYKDAPLGQPANPTRPFFPLRVPTDRRRSLQPRSVIEPLLVTTSLTRPFFTMIFSTSVSVNILPRDFLHRLPKRWSNRLDQ